MNSNQLEAVAHNLLVKRCKISPNQLSAPEFVRPGLIRIREKGRGGSSYLIDETGDFLEYITPTVNDAEALIAFAGGRRTILRVD